MTIHKHIENARKFIIMFSNGNKELEESLPFKIISDYKSGYSINGISSNYYSTKEGESPIIEFIGENGETMKWTYSFGGILEVSLRICRRLDLIPKMSSNQIFKELKESLSREAEELEEIINIDYNEIIEAKERELTWLKYNWIPLEERTNYAWKRSLIDDIRLEE